MVLDTIKKAKLKRKYGYHNNKTLKIRCTIVAEGMVGPVPVRCCLIR